VRLLKRLSPLLIVVVLVGGLVWMSWLSLRQPDPAPKPDGLQSAEGPPLQYRPCADKAPADAFVLSLGNAALWFHRFPHTVITVDDQPALVIDRKPDGSIGIDMTISQDGRKLGTLRGATLEDAGKELRLTRPHASELIVWTAEGAPILQIDYLNGSNLRITGHLSFGRQDFLMESDNFLIGSRSVGNVCLGGDKPVDFRL